MVFYRNLPAVLFAALAASESGAAGSDGLPQPLHVSVAPDADASVLLAARRYAAFWNSGDEHFADIVLAPDFVDRTLPPGRPQGPAGPRAASAGFRAAVPDLSASMDDVVIAGDRAAVHLHFRGHFTGRMGQVTGRGQAVDFQAFDLYRVAQGRIVENWHLEDNLVLQQQLGLLAH